MAQTYRFLILDVFTETALAGNQLAVFTNAVGMSGELMQRIAREINFSETTFVLPPENGGTIRVRIFTATREVPFAGHPTLGTAFAVAGPLQSTLVRIETAERDRAGRPRARGREARLRPDVAADPNGGALRPDRASCWRRLECLRASCRWRSTTTGFAMSTSCCRHSPMSRPCAPTPRGWLVCWEMPGSACSPLRTAASRRACSCPSSGWSRIRQPARRRGRSSRTSPVTGVSRWGEEIEISQGEEIGRPSTLYARVDGADGLIEAVEVGGSAVVVAKGEFVV